MKKIKLIIMKFMLAMVRYSKELKVNEGLIISSKKQAFSLRGFSHRFKTLS